MTYRERREAKAEKLREWARNRNQKATAQLNSQPSLRQDSAFITQPGHIPERARMNRADDMAHESLQKAASMESRASGIEDQLDRSIYSDDPDAVEALEAKVAKLEAKRDQMKKINTLYRKGDAAGLSAMGLDLAELREKLNAPDVYYWCRIPFAAYELQNLGGNIRRLKQRVEDLKQRQGHDAAVQASPTGVVIEHFPLSEGCKPWAKVRFADKPERSILQDLRAAGFRWQDGCWSGQGEKIPSSVLQMAGEVNP